MLRAFVLTLSALAPATALTLALSASPSVAQPVPDQLILQAREAARAADRATLLALRDQTAQARHPLASWVDYWEIGARLKEAQQPELEAFYARWPGTYVEDRLRNDWLLVLGERRDWVNFRREHARFRMADDREVDCYALLIRHTEGADVRQPAQQAWMAQRRDDDGCRLMASTLAEAGSFRSAQIWPMVRLGAETQRLGAARAAVALLDQASESVALDALANPARWLARHGRGQAQCIHHVETDIAPEGQKRALRHVEHVQRAVDQGQTDGRNGIHCAEGKSGGHDLNEDFHPQPPRYADRISGRDRNSCPGPCQVMRPLSIRCILSDSSAMRIAFSSTRRIVRPDAASRCTTS